MYIQRLEHLIKILQEVHQENKPFNVEYLRIIKEKETEPFHYEFENSYSPAGYAALDPDFNKQGFRFSQLKNIAKNIDNDHYNLAIIEYCDNENQITYNIEAIIKFFGLSDIQEKYIFQNTFPKGLIVTPIAVIKRIKVVIDSKKQTKLRL